MAGVRRHGPALLASLPLVLLLTWPLAPGVATLLPNATGDGLENTWNIWWAREALLVRHVNPFWATTIYHPRGASLYFHPLGLAAAPVAIPLQAVVDPPTALVVTLLSLVWLTAVTTYLLLWDIVRHRAAALVGGLFVALAPAHLYHLGMGQLNLTALFPLPFILLAQRRAMRRQWGWGLASALGVVVAALADWQYLVQALLLAGLLLLLELWRQRRQPARAWRTLLWGATPLALGLLALAPLILAMLDDLRANDNYALRPAWQTEVRSADLLSFVTPNPYHPLWGAVGTALYARFYPAIPYAGGVASLGLAALVVAALVAWRRPRARPWLLLLGLGLSLALGPELHVNGVDLGLPLPYQLLHLVPYLNASRVPAIFVKWALLALAVLLALGLRALAAWAGRGRRGRLALAGLSGLIALEGLAVPLAVTERPALSACYQMLATDPRPGVVLDLPAIDANEPMYFQVFHRRTVAGGDLSRDNPYGFLVATPVIANLVRADDRLPRDIFIGEPEVPVRHILAAWEIRWVILRLQQAGPDLPRFEAALARVFGDQAPVCVDATTRLWWVEAPAGVLRLGDGWHRLERLGEDIRYRWMTAEGEVTVYAPSAAPVELSLTAWAYRQPRALDIWAGEHHQARVTIPLGAPATLHIPLVLSPGLTTLRLRAVEPADRGPGDDTRRLTIAVSDLRLSAAGE